MNGISYGEFKTVENLNYLKVHAAGHEVAYYRKDPHHNVYIGLARLKLTLCSRTGDFIAGLHPNYAEEVTAVHIVASRSYTYLDALSLKQKLNAFLAGVMDHILLTG